MAYVPWRVACEFVSWEVSTQRLDSSIVSPLRLRWVKSVCVLRCNPPSAILAEWPGSFTCHYDNTGVERTPNKSAHKVNTGEENSPAAAAGIWTRNHSIRVQRSYQQAFPTPDRIRYGLQYEYTSNIQNSYSFMHIQNFMRSKLISVRTTVCPQKQCSIMACM